MTLHIFPDVEQRSEEWFAQRRGIVTASIVGGLLTTRKLTAIDHDCPNCGATSTNPCIGKRSPEPIKTLHPERAAVAKAAPSPTIIEPASNEESRRLVDRLTAERITGKTHPSFISDDMHRGIVLEPYARDHYARYRDTKVAECGFMLLERGDGVRLGYSPDGIVGDDGLCEIKCPRQQTHLRTVVSGAVPMDYMPQLQAGLLVSGRKWIDFVSFVGGMKLYVRRIYPILQWQQAIAEAVRRFESAAPEIQRAYDEETADMPMTEIVDIEQEIVI